eukprot:13149711-Heterocapsa_arctica.AAC.1
MRYDQQAMRKCIRVSVDSDHPADRATHKSTTIMVQHLGRHPIKATSNLQTLISLNVSEAEFYALVSGAANGLGMQAYLQDLGIELPLIIESDSSRARVFGGNAIYRLGIPGYRTVLRNMICRLSRCLLTRMFVTS